jgi:hypothetical protein
MLTERGQIFSQPAQHKVELLHLWGDIKGIYSRYTRLDRPDYKQDVEQMEQESMRAAKARDHAIKMAWIKRPYHKEDLEPKEQKSMRATKARDPAIEEAWVKDAMLEESKSSKSVQNKTKEVFVEEEMSTNTLANAENDLNALL